MPKNIYHDTYRSHKGKYPALPDALRKLTPDVDECPDDQPALDLVRRAVNCYYDLYNNGLCNRAEEFCNIFGFDYPEEDPDSFNDNRIPEGVDPLTRETVVKVEAVMDDLLLKAAKEQGLTTKGLPRKKRK